MSSEVRFHNSTQRTPCVIVIDASGSMDEPTHSGRTRIEELNEGLKVLHRELLSDSTATARVELALVCVGGPAGDADVLMDWTSVTEFTPPVLSAGGMTPLGAGLRIALDLVESRKMEYKSQGLTYTRPWIMVLSDGEPTDEPGDWQGATSAALAAIQGKKAIIFPIGVEGADLAVLSQVSDRPALGLQAVKFGAFFLWLSKSLGDLSSSRPGDTVQLPPVNAWAAVSS